MGPIMMGNPVFRHAKNVVEALNPRSVLTAKQARPTSFANWDRKLSCSVLLWVVVKELNLP